MQMYSIFEVESVEITGPKELWGTEENKEPTFLLRINVKSTECQSLITLYATSRQPLVIKESK